MSQFFSFPSLQRPSSESAVLDIDKETAVYSEEEETGLAEEDEEEEIPASCLRQANGTAFENFARPRALPCRFDRYGVPRVPLGEQAVGTGVWLSGSDNVFARRNRTIVSTFI